MFKYTKTACSIGSTQSNENFNRVVSAKTQYTFMLRFRKYFIPCCSNCCSEKIRTGVIIKNMFFLKMFSRLYIIFMRDINVLYMYVQHTSRFFILKLFERILPFPGKCTTTHARKMNRKRDNEKARRNRVEFKRMGD